jgi:hypothetical protein
MSLAAAVLAGLVGDTQHRLAVVQRKGQHLAMQETTGLVSRNCGNGRSTHRGFSSFETKIWSRTSTH